MGKIYKRLGIVSLEEVLPHIGKEEKITVLGEKVNLNSQRLKLFKRSLRCVGCGIQGEFFAVERDRKGYVLSYHLNLYAMSKNNGGEILLTKDHIRPKSKGGKNWMSNYQTMCKRCNFSKGDKWVEKNDETKN